MGAGAPGCGVCPHIACVRLFLGKPPPLMGSGGWKPGALRDREEPRTTYPARPSGSTSSGACRSSGQQRHPGRASQGAPAQQRPFSFSMAWRM